MEKLTKNIDWVEKIISTIYEAMSRKLEILCVGTSNFHIYKRGEGSISFSVFDDCISLSTHKGGYLSVNHILTDREQLALQEIALTVKEYNEDLALSQLEEFNSEKEVKLVDINDLDDDDKE